MRGNSYRRTIKKKHTATDVARHTTPSLAPAPAPAPATATAMQRSAHHTSSPDTMRKAAQVARAAKALMVCALLLLAAAPAHASGQHRHGRDAEPGARAPRGNQTTAAASPAPPQEHPPAVGTLQARADAWIANQTRALAAHGPVAAWDTSAETDLGRVFEDAAYFNEDIGRWDTARAENMRAMYVVARVAWVQPRAFLPVFSWRTRACPRSPTHPLRHGMAQVRRGRCLQPGHRPMGHGAGCGHGRSVRICVTASVSGMPGRVQPCLHDAPGPHARVRVPFLGAHPRPFSDQAHNPAACVLFGTGSKGPSPSTRMLMGGPSAALKT